MYNDTFGIATDEGRDVTGHEDGGDFRFPLIMRVVEETHNG